MRTLRAAVPSISLALFVASAAAAMNDPTRPPASFGAAGTAGTADAAATAVRAPPVLQSVIIGRTGPAAIIDGERVEVGGRHRDAQVVRITEDEVVLRQDGVTQVLRMYPDVQKKSVQAREGAPSKPLAPRSKAQ